MSTVSILPGRLRLEIIKMINKKIYCRMLELKTAEIDGIMRAQANHRTGRLLAVFDESVIDSSVLMSKIQKILVEIDHCRNVAEISASYPTNEGVGSVFIRAAVDIAGQLIMPRPLNMIFPVAIKALRNSY